MHHMEVFQCAAEFESFPHFSGPCDSKMKPERLNYCRHVLAAWALGAKVRALPSISPGGPHLCMRASKKGGCEAPRATQAPNNPVSPPPVHCWTPMALLSHERLLQPPLLSCKNARAPRPNIPRGHCSHFPDQVPLDLEGSVHSVVPGLASLGCVQGLPAASSTSSEEGLGRWAHLGA